MRRCGRRRRRAPLRRLQVSMIVLATSNKGQLESVLMGSTTMYCIHHASVPVLVVRGE